MLPSPRVSRLLLAGAVVLAFAGCGYRVARRADLPQAVRRIAIETPTNDSSDPGVEFVVAESLRRELLTRGGLRLVPNPRGADVVIRGRVLPIVTSSRSFSSVVLSLEYTLTLTLELRFEGADGEPLSASGSFRETELYLASADIEVARRNRLEALRRVAQVLAGRVHDALDAEFRP